MIGRGYFTISEAAEWAGVGRWTIQRYIKSGRLPAQRLGPRLLRVRRDDLAALLQPVTGGEPDAAA